MSYPPTIYYECEICGHNHPWEWNGDCRDDAYRFTDEQLDKMHGLNGYEIRTWEERLVEDAEDDL